MKAIVALTAALTVTTAPAFSANTPANQTFSLDATECPPGYLAYLQTLEDDGYNFSSKGSYDRALTLYRERLAKPKPPREDPIIRCDPPETMTFGSKD